MVVFPWVFPEQFYNFIISFSFYFVAQTTNSSTLNFETKKKIKIKRKIFWGQMSMFLGLLDNHERVYMKLLFLYILSANVMALSTVPTYTKL